MPDDTLLVSGKRVRVKDLDDAAHATIHDAEATERERGMAAAILALIDDRGGDAAENDLPRWTCAGCGATAPEYSEGWRSTDAAWCPKCGWLA